ncbi:MAG TPA: response regulator [Planctomycetota bacterium]|nr:response regulator [Planctomycetota bacterium]
MIRLGIRPRVFLAIMAVIGGLLLVTGWVMGGLVDRYLDAEISDTLQRGRRAFESFASVHKAVLVDQARSLAQAPHLRAVLGTPDVDQITVSVTLSSLGDTVSGSLLFVTDGTGRVIADNRKGDELPDLRAKVELQHALAGDESSGIWNYAGHDYIVALCPINVASTALGVLGLGCRVGEQVRELGDATGLDVTMLRDGHVVATSWSGALDPTAPDGEVRNRYAAMRWSDVTANENSRLEVDGRELMATAIALTPDAYQLVLTRPLDNLLLQFRRAKTELFWIGLAIAGVALLVSRWVANRIASPIRALTDAASKLASGDLTANVRVVSSDEIGTLGVTFNSMARQLEAAMHDVMQKARAAEQASDAKSAFLATMSHELRTPLNSILGFNEQLQSSDLTVEQHDYVHTVHASGEQLLTLIDELLDYVKMESGDFRLDRVEFDIANCIHRAVETLSAAIRHKGLALDVAISPAVPRLALGPMRHVQQVLIRYLNNAAKFTSQGSIRVRASVTDRTEQHFVLRIEVDDTGIGVAADRVDQLFKPFSQLESGAARSYAGTGVGLAISKELVELMHGEVGVRSTPGEGSSFWFTARLELCAPRASSPPPAIPARAPRASATTAPVSSADSATRARRSKQRILIVEDNPVNQKMAGIVLKKAGWAYSIAEDGQRAVAAAAAESFDLVLMDCQMPVMDGFEATTRIRASAGSTPRDVPILALTANALDGDREACMRAGMDDFVAKPFRAAELVAVMDRWIESRSAARSPQAENHDLAT